MRHLPVSERSWKKIVYWSHKNTGIRVMIITWIAVCLFCYHLGRYSFGYRGRRRMAAAMAAFMVISLVGPLNPGDVYADEEEETSSENEPDEITYEMVLEQIETGDVLEDGFRFEIVAGEECQLEIPFVIHNTGEGDLTNLNLATSLIDIAWSPYEMEEPLENQEEGEANSEVGLEGNVSEENSEIENSEPEETPEPEEENELETVEEPEGSPEEEPEGNSESENKINVAAGESYPILVKINGTFEEGEVNDIIVVAFDQLEEGMSIPVTIVAANNSEEPEEVEEIPEEDPIEEPESEDENASSEEEIKAEDNVEGKEVIAPSISFNQIANGKLKEGTFWMKDDSAIEFSVQDGSAITVDYVIASYGDKKEYLPVENGLVSWTCKEEFKGVVYFGYVNEDNQEVYVASQQVIRDDTAPIVEGTIDERKSSDVILFINDDGIVKTGINNYKITVDGEEAEADEVRVLQTIMNFDEKVETAYELHTTLSIGLHEMAITITDNSGNTTEKTLFFDILPQDVISIVLPTTFYLGVNIALNTVQSEDIVVCNKSEFPVDVTVAMVNVEINKEIPGTAITSEKVDIGSDKVYNLTTSSEKTCDLQMKLTSEEETVNYATPEGVNLDLAKRTLVQNSELQVSFSGTIEEKTRTYWRDGDLTIHVVFTFAKHVEEE